MVTANLPSLQHLEMLIISVLSLGWRKLERGIKIRVISEPLSAIPSVRLIWERKSAFSSSMPRVASFCREAIGFINPK